MAQASWAAKTTTWATDPYLFANTTYSDNAELASNVSTLNNANALYPSGIILTSNGAISGSGGFSLVGVANFDLGTSSTSSTNTIYVNAIEFNGNAGLASVGNMPITGSITLGSSVGIQQSDLPGWSLASGTWAGSTDTWNYGTPISLAVSANLTQINLSELHEEDAEKIASTVYAMATGATASGNIIAPVSATLENNQNLKFNINFEESITITGISNITSSNNFLWNDQEEDSTTTWTKISDPDA